MIGELKLKPNQKTTNGKHLSGSIATRSKPAASYSVANSWSCGILGIVALPKRTLLFLLPHISLSLSPHSIGCCARVFLKIATTRMTSIGAVTTRMWGFLHKHINLRFVYACPRFPCVYGSEYFNFYVFFCTLVEHSKKKPPTATLPAVSVSCFNHDERAVANRQLKTIHF